jgi:hypothetical protein
MVKPESTGRLKGAPSQSAESIKDFDSLGGFANGLPRIIKPHRVKGCIEPVENRPLRAVLAPRQASQLIAGSP